MIAGREDGRYSNIADASGTSADMMHDALSPRLLPRSFLKTATPSNDSACEIAVEIHMLYRLII